MSWIAFIESNTSGTGPQFLHEAESLGFGVALICADVKFYRFHKSPNWRILTIPTDDCEQVIHACNTLDGEGGLCGVMSSSDYFIHSAAIAAQTLGLPSLHPDAVLGCIDKARQRATLDRAGIPAPRWTEVRSSNQGIEAASHLNFPLVCKPVFGSGKVGVRLVHNVAELTTHLERLFAVSKNDRGISITPRVLLEQYILGSEYSVEVVGTQVVGITEKLQTAPPLFIETGHNFPAVLDPAKATVLRSTALRAVHALNLFHGCKHIEIRLNGSGPFLIEVNARLAGGMIPELIRLAHGVNLVRETVRATAGLPTHLDPDVTNAASIRFILPSGSGTIESIEGARLAEAVPGVTEVVMYRSINDRFEPAGDFHDRIGHVIAKRVSTTEAAAAVTRAASLIRVTLAKDF